ncbi:MAG: DUF6308 family protein [Candidatus Bathyarchaeota archaeon]|nr:DUF6308 family protein [Candidatus Bathyarchaeum tardum]
MIRLQDDVIFRDSQSRIREYCEIEVYRGYDDKHSIDNKISKEDIESANNLAAMIDRYDTHESKRLLGQSWNISKILSSIPNTDIFAIPDNEWVSLRPKIKKLLDQLLAIRGIGLAKATKILHLKRPKLFPVLDSFVIKFLFDSTDSNVDIGLMVLDSVRELIIKQRTEFEKLLKQTSDLPIYLTPVRLFDILCWTAEKWDIRGNHNAPYGTAHKSLLAIPKNGYKTEEDKIYRISDVNLSSTMSIVSSFINSLIDRAKYGVNGEKPLALISALKYLHNNEIFGIELLDIIDSGEHSDKVKDHFISLAENYQKIKNPSGSWSIITGSQKELQNAIRLFGPGDVNKAFSELKLEEIESLLNIYVKRLEI